MSAPLDSTLCKELAGHIETLTHSGLKSLDAAVMKKIKKICRLSDGYVEQAHHLALFQLARPHAEMRFSAFQIIDELFRRSHCFRELLVSNMQRIMELTVEISADHPLPPPRTAALNLKRFALRSFREWNNEYGDGYKKLQLGFNFLKHCKKVDFNALEIEDNARRMREQELERRQKAINEERLKKVEAEIKELQAEINGTLTSLKNCLELLVPVPQDFSIFDERVSEFESSSDSEESLEETVGPFNEPSTSKIEINLPNNRDGDYDEDKDDIFMENYRKSNKNLKLELEIKPGGTSIIETPENAAVFENARDLNTLIVNRYLPFVKKWETMITKCSGSPEQLRNVINLKSSLEDAMKKFSQISMKTVSANSSDSSDSEFEDIEEKDGYEEAVREELPPVQIIPDNDSSSKTKNQKTKSEGGWSIWSKENDEKDPTSAQSTLAALAPPKPSEIIAQKDDVIKTSKELVMKETLSPPPPPCNSEPSTSNGNERKSKLLAIAPKLPFDVDLYHWEDEKVTAPTMLSVKPEGARFWSATSNDDLEEIPVPDGAASLRTRVIEFSGKFEPVKWACRAPMKNGKLCPRRDRYKCPLHGPVVPRDETGKCTNPEYVEKLEQHAEEEKQEIPDWQDPQLLADIKASTGIDLKMPERGKDGRLKRKKKKKKEENTEYPGLTDISASENTSIKRLSKKIFKRSTMKRVAQALDRADHKRYRDKFGDQFNYVYDR